MRELWVFPPCLAVDVLGPCPRSLMGIVTWTPLASVLLPEPQVESARCPKAWSGVRQGVGAGVDSSGPAPAYSAALRDGSGRASS